MESLNIFGWNSIESFEVELAFFASSSSALQRGLKGLSWPQEVRWAWFDKAGIIDEW